MRVLITGICGFVGSRIAIGLKRRLADVQITGFDNFSRPGSARNLSALAEAKISARHGDLRCASDFEALGDCDWVIDAAANPSVLAGVDGRTSTRQLVEHNLSGTINVLEFCRQRRSGLVLLSTSRVYNIASLAAIPLTVRNDAFVPGEGEWPNGSSADGIDERFSTAPPASLYGATKLASEALAAEYGAAFDLPVVINRCGVIAGPGQFGTAEQGIFSYWIGSWAARQPLTYLGFNGSGHQVRDALHPDDLTELLHRQMAAGREASGTWAVGGGRSQAMSLAQLSHWCREHLGEHVVLADRTSRRWDIPWVVMDSQRVQAAFGWSPSRSLDSTLREIAAHYAAHPDWLQISRPYV